MCQLRPGSTIGRNPYDSRKLQVIKQDSIVCSNELTNLTAFQYSLTGYTHEGKGGGFFKGILTVIDEQLWPKEYRDCNILVSSKDQKLCHDWINSTLKSEAQNAKSFTKMVLRGVLAVKQHYCNNLIGIPLKIAELSAGDYDGDEYNIVSIAKLDIHKLALMLEHKKQLPNPKINKTFTPKTTIGNYSAVIHFNNNIIQRWSTIYNVFCTLNKEERQQFYELMSPTNILKDLTPESYMEKCKSPKEIVLNEIQLGLKYGQDSFKTKVPYLLLLIRAKQYERALRQWNKLLSIPYGSKFKGNLSTEVAEVFKFSQNKQEASAKIKPLLFSVLKEKKGYNIVAKTQRTLAKSLIKGLGS
jgi:hypothetical protein